MHVAISASHVEGGQKILEKGRRVQPVAGEAVRVRVWVSVKLLGYGWGQGWGWVRSSEVATLRLGHRPVDDDHGQKNVVNGPIQVKPDGVAVSSFRTPEPQSGTNGRWSQWIGATLGGE